MKIFYIVFIFISFSQFVDAQLGINLAPLKLDNFWIYKKDDGYRYKYEVIDTNFYINTIKYDKVFYSRFPNNPSFHRLRDDKFYSQRRDSTYPALNHEQLYYKKDAVVGDYWIIPHPWTNMFNIHYQVVDTQMNIVFNQLSLLKFVYVTDSSGLWEIGQVWTEEFGLLEEIDFVWGPLATLVGCYIDGIVYGDTSLTVSVDDEPFTAHNFKLYQNYPNPFNPITTIEYELNEYALVSLKVYDLLGNEAAVLINEEKYAGRYSIKFDAQGLSSGVYFYKLTIGGNTQVRKMILLR
jgi:hypothetical protein